MSLCLIVAKLSLLRNIFFVRTKLARPKPSLTKRLTCPLIACRNGVGY